MKDNLYVNEKEKNGQPNVDDDGNGFVDDIYGYNFVTAKTLLAVLSNPMMADTEPTLRVLLLLATTTERVWQVSQVAMVRQIVVYAC